MVAPQLMGGAVQSISSQVEKDAEELKLEAAAVPTLRLRSRQAFSQKRREMGHPILMLCKLFNLRCIVGS
jgi:hypothetical protein